MKLFNHHHICFASCNRSQCKTSLDQVTTFEVQQNWTWNKNHKCQQFQNVDKLVHITFEQDELTYKWHHFPLISNQIGVVALESLHPSPWSKQGFGWKTHQARCKGGWILNNSVTIFSCNFNNLANINGVYWWCNAFGDGSKLKGPR